jgi:hypothetical protein
MTIQTASRIRIEDLPALETLTEEEMARIFGAGRQNRVQLGVEALETRNLMAASLAASFTNGLLRVEGTEAADRIVIRQIGSNLQVEGVTITGADGKPFTPLATAVTSVRVDALGANDLVWVQGDLAMNIEVRDGPGADLIVAGPQSRVNKDADTPLVLTSVIPLWRQLETLTPNANGQYDLGSAKVGSFSLTNATATVSAAGIALNGNLNLPVFGTVRLAGTVTPDNTFTATMPEKELLDGLAWVKGTRLTLKGDQATVEATLAVANLGVSSNLTGWIKADGKYSLEATASFKVAGFQVDGGKMFLGDKLNVNFTVPISSFGNVTFTGSYGLTGWSVQGTSPVTVQLGIVTLKQITFGVTRDSQTGDLMILRAKGTIASINGIVDATATAKVYTDGRINLDVTADALKVGTFTVGKSQVTVRNDTPAGRSVRRYPLGRGQHPGRVKPCQADRRGRFARQLHPERNSNYPGGRPDPL